MDVIIITSVVTDGEDKENDIVVNTHCQFDVLVVNYGISNTFVLEIA